MGASIEEEELTTQRDAVVSLCKGLQEKVIWDNCIDYTELRNYNTVYTYNQGRGWLQARSLLNLRLQLEI